MGDVRNNPLGELWAHIQGLRDGFNELRGKVEGLRELRGLGGDPRSDIGPVERYLQDGYNLPPEVVRIEHLEFRIRIEDGKVTFQDAPKSIDPEFTFILRRIKGWAASNDEQTLQTPLPHKVTVNLADNGRARQGLFEDPIRLSTLCQVDGSPAHDMVWDAFYRYQVSATVKAVWDFDVDAFDDTGVDVEFGIAVTGDLVRTRTLPGGALITDTRGDRR